MRHVLFALALLLPVQDPPPTTDCATCTGKGTAVVSCETCDGAGKGPCYRCAGPTAIDIFRERSELRRLTHPDEADELLAQLEKMEAQFEELSESPLFDFRTVPGSVRCPGSCASGKSFLNRGLPCKPCAGKGRIECVTCKGKGTATCGVCTGKKKLELPCPECLGRGESPTLATRTTANVASCPWCADARLLECRACDEGLRERSCAPCGATGKGACKECAGGQKARCNKCSSTGDLSSYFAAKSSNKCDVCKRKGYLSCKACKKGLVTCETCGGKKKGRFTCDHCFGEKQALCRGCRGGSGRAWVVTGDRLLAAGQKDLGLDHLREALRREEAVKDEKLTTFEGTSKERTALRRELDRDLKDLRTKIKKAEKD